VENIGKKKKIFFGQNDLEKFSLEKFSYFFAHFRKKCTKKYQNVLKCTKMYTKCTKM